MSGIASPWFDWVEYEKRLHRVQRSLVEKGLDGLIAFQPETVTWLPGFFTRGYGSFQCAIIPADGLPVIICRDVKECHIDATCAFPGHEMWSDGEDPVKPVSRAGIRLAGKSAHLRSEMSAGRHDSLTESLPGISWQDESSLVSEMQLIRSEAEIACRRRAGKAAEAGMRAAIDTAPAGESDREIAAEICLAVIRAGSDLPGSGVLSSGQRAFQLHGGHSDRILEHVDLVQFETTPNVRRHHARFMRPLRVDQVSDDDLLVVDALIAIQDAALCEVRAGAAATVPEGIYREGVLSAGLRTSDTNKTFHSVGLLLRPSGGEAHEATPGSQWVFEAGMAFHTYVLAPGFGMSETIAVTGDGHERLTNFDRCPFVA